MSSKITSKDSTSPKRKSKLRTSLKNVQVRKENSESTGKTSPKKSVGSKTTARIPCSREDSSSNWKALLQKQGKKPLPTLTSQAVNSVNTKAVEGKESLSSKLRVGPSTSFRDKKSDKKPLKDPSPVRSFASTMSTDMEGTCSPESRSSSSRSSVEGSRKVKKEFRALGLSESQNTNVQQKPRSRPSGSSAMPRGFVKKIPFAVGVNELGYFNYDHYGVLECPLTPALMKYTEDTGIIAMDCEMVGVGIMKESALGRVSIVNEYGYCLYDAFVKPKMEITDYRTEFSGIREKDMEKAVPFHVAVKNVANLLRNHILVGHSLKSDMSVLFLNHPKAQIRDTALFFKKIFHTNTPKLRTLVKKALDVKIQEGEHSSITDAQATMALYQLYQPNWEEYALQTNRGVDVFRQTLDQFNNSKVAQGANSTRFKKSATWYAEGLAHSGINPLHEVFGNDDLLTLSNGAPAFSAASSPSHITSGDSSCLTTSQCFSPAPLHEEQIPNLNNCYYPLPPPPPIPAYNDPTIMPSFNGGFSIGVHPPPYFTAQPQANMHAHWYVDGSSGSIGYYTYSITGEQFHTNVPLSDYGWVLIQPPAAFSGQGPFFFNANN